MTTETASALLGALLGGGLTIFASILTTLWSDFRSQLRSDEQVLRALEPKLLTLLSDYLEPMNAARLSSNTTARAVHEDGANRLLVEIYALAWQIRCRRYSKVAAEIVDFDLTNTPESVIQTVYLLRRKLNANLSKALYADEDS